LLLQEMKNGFLHEDEIRRNGYPSKIHEYPAFVNWIKEFYPGISYYTVTPYGNFYDLFMTYPDNNKVLIPLFDFAQEMHNIYIRKRKSKPLK